MTFISIELIIIAEVVVVVVVVVVIVVVVVVSLSLFQRHLIEQQSKSLTINLKRLFNDQT